MNRTIYRLATVMWVIGTLLIVASWFGWVPHVVGWAGFGLSLAGALVQFFAGRRW